MNKSQLELRLKALKAWGDELTVKVKQVELKTYRGDGQQLKKDVADYLAEKEHLDWHAKRLNVDAKAASIAGAGGNAAHFGGIEPKAVASPVPSPLAIPVAEYKGLYDA